MNGAQNKYEKKLIEHNKHSTRQTADFCVDNNMCAHGTNGFALFLALAIAKGKLLSKNDRKLAGLVAITGEALTDNKSLKNSMGPSKEDLFDYNFVSAIALDRECELGLADEYAKKASSSFTCDYETLITKLSKKFSKYLNINENKIRGYVFSNKEDIEFLQDLTKKITDNKEEISFISREEINLFKEDKLLSDFNDTHNKIIIDKDLPCKWHRLNNCSTENKLVSQKTRIRYSVFSANKLPSLNSQGEDCIASYKL